MLGTLRSGPRPPLPDPGPNFERFGRPIAERVTDNTFQFHGYAWQARNGFLDTAETHYQDLGAPRDASARGSVRMSKPELYDAEIVAGASTIFWTHLLDVLSNDDRYSEQVAGLSPAGLADRLRDVEWSSGSIEIDAEVLPSTSMQFKSLVGVILPFEETLVTVVGSREFASGPLRLATSPTITTAEEPNKAD